MAGWTPLFWTKNLDSTLVMAQALPEETCGSPPPEQQAAAQEAARAVCLVIAALLEIPYLRTSTLMALAATADLVPRLWFSVLRVRVEHSEGRSRQLGMGAGPHKPKQIQALLHGHRTSVGLWCIHLVRA